MDAMATPRQLEMVGLLPVSAPSQSFHARPTCSGADGPGEWLRAAAALAVQKMPRATVCLTTAAWFEGLLDEPPRVLWLALPAGTHGALLDDVPHRLIRWSHPGAFDVGIIRGAFSDVRVARTGPARTVVDLIRYARHVRGEHVGIEVGRRWAASGGDARDILEVAHSMRTPAGAMHTLEVLASALETRPIQSAR